MKAPFPRCLSKVVLTLLEDLDTPISRQVSSLIANGEWDQLVTMKTDPSLYLDPQLYLRDVIATSILRKCGDIPTSVDVEAVALEAFYAAEKQCCVSNLRLRPYLYNGPFEDPRELSIADFFVDCRRWMARVLGPLPGSLSGYHGRGGTFNDRGRLTTIPDKMQSTPTVTKQAVDLLPFLYRTAWGRALVSDAPSNGVHEVIRGNRFASVPKDATKNRGIGVEPSINVFFQIEVGRVLRQRLKKACNIDLKTGQAKHKQVARAASISGAFDTLDMSSASDTVCRILPQLLLPEDWYQLLCTLRSPLTLVNEKWLYLEKFSSMGNGFTFELETLIFLCLACVVADRLGRFYLPGRDIHVYGDDIILPADITAVCIPVYQYCGFTLNKSKSFTGDCKFRESCGGDYLNGSSVRPYFIEEYPDDPAAWIALANGLRRLGHQDLTGVFFDRFIRRAWFRALDNLPVAVRRCRGPVALGDEVIHDSPSAWSCVWKDQIRYIETWSPVTKPIPLSKWKASVQFASALYGVPSSGPVVRGSVSGYRTRWMELTVFGESPLAGDFYRHAVDESIQSQSLLRVNNHMFAQWWCAVAGPPERPGDQRKVRTP